MDFYEALTTFSQFIEDLDKLRDSNEELENKVKRLEEVNELYEKAFQELGYNPKDMLKIGEKH